MNLKHPLNLIGTSLICICLVTSAHAQSPKSLSFDELIRHAKTIGDSLPRETKAYLLASLKLSQGQKPAAMAWVYNELGSLFSQESKYDSSLLFYRKGLRFAIAARDVKEEIGSYEGIIDNLLNLSLLDSSHIYLTKALKVARQHHLYAEEAGLYSDMGNLYRDQNDLETSLSYFVKAATIYDSLDNDPVGYSRTLSNIANVHYVLGNYDKALEYVNQSNPIAKEHAFLKGLAYNHKLAGRIYRQKKDLVKAMQEYQLALASYEKNGDKYNVSETSLNIGNLLYDQENYSKALIEYKKALALARSIGVKSLMAHSYSAIGYAYYAVRNWKPASLYMDSTRLLATEIKSPYLVMDAYDILYLIESEQKHFEKALHYMERYVGIKDSLTTAENRGAVEEIEAKYQNDKKTAAIELLQKDQQIHTAAIRQNKIAIAAIATALVAAVVIAILLLNRYRLLNRTKRQIEMERMRNQIARDLHDDIGSTLSSINIISQVALKENGQAKIQTPHFQSIYDHSARMMENMSDIVWSIHPGNDSMEKVVIKMKEFCAEILEPKDIAYTFENDDVLSGISLDLESRKNLFLIFKEIVNNAAKYSEATAVKILFSKDQQRWSMDISDNGKGFQVDSAKLGNGLNNIQKRAEAMAAKFSLTTSPGGGTRIHIDVNALT